MSPDPISSFAPDCSGFCTAKFYVSAGRHSRKTLEGRGFPFTLSVVVERKSLELLPILSSTGPGSIRISPEIPVQATRTQRSPEKNFK
jgi:hypothetical protein